MPMKKYTPDQIVTLLRQIEMEIANGKTTLEACPDAQITAQMFYPSRKEYRRPNPSSRALAIYEFGGVKLAFRSFGTISDIAISLSPS